MCDLGYQSQVNSTTGLPAKIHNLFRLSLQISQELSQQIEAETSLSLTQYQFLYAVQARNDVTLSDIAEMLGCTRGNVTGLAERLARQNWIQRTIDPDDRRRTVIHLTPDGKKRLQEACKIINKFAEEFDLTAKLCGLGIVDPISTSLQRQHEYDQHQGSSEQQLKERPHDLVPQQLASQTSYQVVRSPVVRLTGGSQQDDSVVVIKRK